MANTINLADLEITLTCTTSTCSSDESSPMISSTYEISDNNDQQAVAPPLVLNQEPF